MFKKLSISIAVYLTIVLSLAAQDNKNTAGNPVAFIRNSFLKPPASARPWVYWFWTNSNVTRKGITADLEAMNRVGIGGVLIMDVNQGTPASTISFMDEKWKQMFAFAVQEASRLGMEINMNNDAGWTGSGGPWVKPEFAMQNVISTETIINGGGEVNTSLPHAPANGDYYRDIAVVALQDPDSVTSDPTIKPSISIVNGQQRKDVALPSQQNPLKLFLDDPVNLPSINIKFSDPYSVCVIDITIPMLGGRIEADLQASSDGKEFKSLKKNHPLKAGKNSISFNVTSAQWYRIKIVKLRTYLPIKELDISSISLHNRYQIDNLEMKLLNTFYKHGIKFNPTYLEDIKSADIDQVAPGHVIIPKNKVLDVTLFMDASGNFKWNAPAGKWTVIRFGHTWNGAVNSPAAFGGEGPECDKLSKEGIRNHWEGMAKPLINLVKKDVGKTLTTFHIDSWEINGQNWTKGMQNEFKKRRGYDITTFLPVYNGRIIGDLQQTERFMFDVRKTISELMVENYVGEIQKICHENGLKFSFECYTHIANGMDAANFVDEPISEVWQSPGFHFTVKAMASAGHINDKKIVSAEIFTSGWDEKWLSFPGSIKVLGDSAFTGGINKFIFHRYAMQPWLNQKPGVSMGPWGLHYERTNTWWEYTKPWHTYLARCQYLLRQGRVVSDILNLQPEEPGYWFKDQIIAGHNYVACSPDAFKKVTFKNGNLIDGSGNTYKMLLLTHLGTMSEPMLKHLHKLVMEGASILGDPPLETPGLTDYPNADKRLKTIVEEIWGPAAQTITDRKAGKGRVFRNMIAEDAMKKLEVHPDFISDGGLNYIHRKSGETDIYFIANPKESVVMANCSFRVKGKRPLWWNPETGQIKNIFIYTSDDKGMCRLPIILPPAGSGFVIFTSDKKEDAERIITIIHDDETLVENGIASDYAKKNIEKASMIRIADTVSYFPGTYVFTKMNGKKITVKTEQPKEKTEINSKWLLKFPEGYGLPENVQLTKLQSWTEMNNKEINYFSGMANYNTDISIPSISKGTKLFLDLGEVKVMARIFVNGKNAGILWRKPYRTDITSLVQPGQNKLRIEIVNQWANRQIGDEFLPEDSERTTYERYQGLPYPAGVLKSWPSWVLDDKKSPAGRQTFTTWRLWKKDDKLDTSGLLGPVTLEQVKLISIN